MFILQGLIPIMFGICAIYLTNNLVSTSPGLPPRLNISLSIYKNSRVYYRAGDDSVANLESTFVALSKTNQAAVSEALPTNYIIIGKSI